MPAALGATPQMLKTWCGVEKPIVDLELFRVPPFALYLLAILATSLRNDGRIATFAGLLASLEWIALLHFFGNNTVDMMGEVEELIIIAAATTLARIIVSRARGLRLSSIRDNLTGLRYTIGGLGRGIRRLLRSGSRRAIGLPRRVTTTSPSRDTSSSICANSLRTSLTLRLFIASP